MECYKCKAAEMKPTRAQAQVQIGGCAFVGSVEAVKCPSCETVLLDGPALERFELVVAAKLGEAGEASGPAFKHMRKAIGMKATDLAVLLDVRPETISRWETDAQPVERRALALLVALVADELAGSTATLDRLRALAKPRKLAKSVRVGKVAA